VVGGERAVLVDVAAVGCRADRPLSERPGLRVEDREVDASVLDLAAVQTALTDAVRPDLAEVRRPNPAQAVASTTRKIIGACRDLPFLAGRTLLDGAGRGARGSDAGVPDRTGDTRR